MPDRVTVDPDGHVLLIGVNRPEKRNAFDLAMIEQLAAAYDRLGRRRRVRVGVLFAHGDHFSAGLDLAEVGPAVAERGPEALAGTGEHDPFGVWGSRSQADGDGGAGNRVHAVDRARAGVPTSSSPPTTCGSGSSRSARGIMPFGGATLRAPRAARLGQRDALPADRARSSAPRRRCGSGSCRRSFRPGQQLERAVEIAERHRRAGAARRAGDARECSHRARRPAERDAAEHLEETAAAGPRSEDAAEGVQSFVERRAARFTGA